jgi:hypothetical protein
MSGLPVVPAHRLEATPPEHRWLVEGLWGREAVGIIGGEPKCCKSFLALQLATAVASGKPCLERFAVKQPGRVLLYAAEDALHVVRERLGGLCERQGLSLPKLDLWVITAPRLRLDLDDDRQKLVATVDQLKPTLMILDPFVRLHRVDENVSAAVAPLLDFLRRIQRRFGCAIAVVHHSRKGGATRAGQALRGSSEFHAWGDSNLYLRRYSDERLTLAVEHRAQPGQQGLPLRLTTDDGYAALALADSDAKAEPAAPPTSDRLRILTALRDQGRPMSRAEIRQHCRMRTETLGRLLKDLADDGAILRNGKRWRLPPTNPGLPLPFPFPENP